MINAVVFLTLYCIILHKRIRRLEKFVMPYILKNEARIVTAKKTMGL